ncbi:hypothetical protein F4804DRAFT_99652 [Jackrogersella minutella]|nr:hypothetical protein F4804DRAFT_99652 [Jackrogersella minutella]
MSDQDNGPQLAATVWLFLPLAAITLALRCYVRVRILKAFKIEDWLAIATMMCFTLYCTLVMLSISYGAGKEMIDVPIENVSKILKMRWAAEVVYIVTTLFVKFTVGVFLLRICSQTWQKSVICTVLLVCLVYGVFFAFMAAFQCRPVAYYWDRYTGSASGTCFSDGLVTGTTYAGAAVNAVSDWVLGLLPIALVRNLELSRRSKVMVSCTLALGSIASAATIVRIPYIWQLTSSAHDVLHVFTDLSIWSTVENGLGLTASSLATLRPLFKKVFGATRAGSPSPRRSFYSWRKSGTVTVHHLTRSGNMQYHRMHDYGLAKPPGRAKLRDAEAFDVAYPWYGQR